MESTGTSDADSTKWVAQSKALLEAITESARLCAEARQQAEAACSAIRADQASATESSRVALEAREGAERASQEAHASGERASTAASAAEAGRASIEVHREAAALAAASASESRDAALESKTLAKSANEGTEAELQKAALASTASGEAGLAAGKSRLEADSARDEALVLLDDVKKSNKAVGGLLASIEKSRADADGSVMAAAAAASTAAEESKRAAEAHNLSTTAGLAGAFNERAVGAAGRERFWAVTLVIALVAALVIGLARYSDLASMVNSKPETGILVIHFLLSLFGVAAPVWLAWMSTRMIARNFAIREDYAYKAAIAKAYVGFREQARGLDPILEQRLFAAAITQLDANPVRFIDSAHPGSPLQDLLQQPFMQEALRQEAAKQQLLDWLKTRFKFKLPNPPEAPSIGTAKP
jgi:chemotaxis protein histidine kinase CheA